MKKAEARIVVNGRIMVGKPIVKGTRITVEAIIKRMASGWTVNQILDEYPQLKEDDIMAALEYAAEVVSQEEIMPTIINTA